MKGKLQFLTFFQYVKKEDEGKTGFLEHKWHSLFSVILFFTGYFFYSTNAVYTAYLIYPLKKKSPKILYARIFADSMII